MKWKNLFLLLLTALIWGTAFVAQSVGMDYVGPFTFLCVRSVIGFCFLLLAIPVLDAVRGKPENDKKSMILGGICCGAVLFSASILQQIGIQYTTVGKGGFITAMYIVLVPAFGIFLGRRTGLHVWGSVALAVTGLYLLCIKEDFSLNRGDAFILCCAVAFTVHILVIDYFSPRTDGVRMSCIQFLVCGLIALPGMIAEHPQWEMLAAGRIPILYAGVMSSGVAYTLQILGQRNMNPTVASLVLSLESVISLIAGWIILKEAMSGRELFGCVLLFIAIIAAQIPVTKFRVRQAVSGDEK